MKTMILGLLSLITALSLTACSGKCDGIKYGKAPRQLFGKMITFDYKETTGTYESLENQSLITKFDEDANTYEMNYKDGTFYSSGSYSYRKVAPNRANLLMMSSTRSQDMNKLHLRLNFNDCDEGIFEGELSQGSVGKQSGTFSLK